MRALLAAPLVFALTVAAGVARAQGEDAPLPPPPPPPPGALLDEPPARPPAPVRAPSEPPATETEPAAPPSSEDAPAHPERAPAGSATGELPPPPPSPSGAAAPGPSIAPSEAIEEPAPGPVKKPRSWYGWQVIIMDGSALAVLVSGGSARLLALPLFLVGGPVVHGAHKQGVRAAISLGLRAGVPVLAGTLAAPAKRCRLDVPTDCTRGLHPATLLSAIGVSVFDSVVLARTPRPNAPQARRHAFTVSPSVVVERDGARAVLVGSF